MENQHRKISGYRELDQKEIDLMNEAKALERQFLDLQARIAQCVRQQEMNTSTAVNNLYAAGKDETTEFERLIAVKQRIQHAEPGRWAAIAKTDIQTATMALVRAVAQPTNL